MNSLPIEWKHAHVSLDQIDVCHLIGTVQLTMIRWVNSHVICPVSLIVLGSIPILNAYGNEPSSQKLKNNMLPEFLLFRSVLACSSHSRANTGPFLPCFNQKVRFCTFFFIIFHLYMFILRAEIRVIRVHVSPNQIGEFKREYFYKLVLIIHMCA